MSKYTHQIDSSERICPYCGATYQPEGEDYTEDPYTEECDECGKKYHASESFSVDHHAVPDCELNGEEHQWEPHKLSNGRLHNFCSVCDSIGKLVG